MNKLLLKDVIELIERKGGKLLSEEYINITSKLKVRCSEGHIWEPSFCNLKKGTWCPICACWSEEEKEYITKNKDILSIKQIANNLNRTYGAVCNMKRKIFGTNKNHFWKNEDINYIKENCKKVSLKKIATDLNRSVSSIRGKKYKERIDGFYYIMEKETLEKMSEAMKGKNLNENNGVWKGDLVSIGQLHQWVRRHKTKTGICQDCKKSEKEVRTLDLANISGKYKRDINDFEWLCRRCHMKKDGRLENMYKRSSFIEVIIQDFCYFMKLNFLANHYMQIEDGYDCDILIPIQQGIKKPIVIECDGDFIHCNPKFYAEDYIRFTNSLDKRTAKDIWEKDKKRTEQLEAKGYIVIRLWEEDIRKMSLEDFRNVLYNSDKLIAEGFEAVN